MFVYRQVRLQREQRTGYGVGDGGVGVGIEVRGHEGDDVGLRAVLSNLQLVLFTLEHRLVVVGVVHTDVDGGHAVQCGIPAVFHIH